MTSSERQILQEVQRPQRDILTFVIKSETKRKLTSTLNLSNPTESTIAFKLKSTSPNIIKIKPDCGYMKPKGNAEIKITALSVRDNQMMCSILERIVVVLAICDKKHPRKASKWWRNVPKYSLRIVFPVKFVEENKTKKDKFYESFDEREESSLDYSA